MKRQDSFHNAVCCADIEGRNQLEPTLRRINRMSCATCRKKNKLKEKKNSKRDYRGPSQNNHMEYSGKGRGGTENKRHIPPTTTKRPICPGRFHLKGIEGLKKTMKKRGKGGEQTTATSEQKIEGRKGGSPFVRRRTHPQSEKEHR